MTDQKTCEQRIKERMESRLADLEPITETDIDRMKAIFNDYGWPDDNKKALDNPEELTNRELSGLLDFANELLQQSRSDGVLEIDKSIVINVLLSTGGPEDGFEVRYNPETKEFVSGVYYFKDWYDGARRPLSDEELDNVVQAYFLECMIENE